MKEKIRKMRWCREDDGVFMGFYGEAVILQVEEMRMMTNDLL